MSSPVRFNIATWQPPANIPSGSPAQRLLRGVAMLIGRSLFPIIAIAVIAGTPLWGPWGTLVLASLCFLLIMRVA